MTFTDPHPSKLSVIGAGSVGASVAYASLIRGSASVVALYDIATQKVNAEVADLAHGTQYTPSVIVGGDDISVVKDSDVVIITAGARQKPGQSRLDLAGVNAGILKSLMPQLVEQAPDALYVIVTNPCDVMTVVAQKVSGLDPSRVFSTGTMLDSSRLRYLISQRTNVAVTNVHAMIVGEHGDSELPVWSNASIGSVPIKEWLVHGQSVFTTEELNNLAHEVVEAAYKIIAGKGATNYAIGLTGARLTEALLTPKRTILPLSTIIDGYLGLHGVALSMPTLVSSAGIKRIVEIDFSPEEKKRFLESAATIEQNLKDIGF